MKSNRNHAGSILAIAFAVAFLLAGTMFLLMPAVHKPGGGSFEAYMLSMAENGLFFRISQTGRILLALAGLGALPAIMRLVEPQETGWAAWARNLALLSLAVMAVESLRQLFLVPIEAQAYLAVDESIRAAIGGDNTHLTLDPRGWLQFGVLGVSILILNLLARKRNDLPRGWSLLGMALSVCLLLVVTGNLAGLAPVTNGAAALAGIVLGPLWFGWAGLLLRATTASSPLP